METQDPDPQPCTVTNYGLRFQGGNQGADPFSQTWIQVKHFQQNSDPDPHSKDALPCAYTEMVEKFLYDSHFCRIGVPGTLLKERVN
jgi:hypothetical protein